MKLTVMLKLRGVCSAVLGYFQHRTLRCVLPKTITAPHLILRSHIQCGVMRCGLKFNQNHNRTAPHFCSHICGAVYKMRFELFEISIFFKFWAFSTKSKTNFSLCFGPSFKLLSQFFFILGWFFQSTLARVIKLFFFNQGY